MSLYDDGDGVEEAPEVAMPPEGSEGVETDGDAEETVDVEKAAAEAAWAVEAADGAEEDESVEDGDDGDGGSLLVSILAIVATIGALILSAGPGNGPGRPGV